MKNIKNNIETNEEPKYLKQKESNISKANKKSKHKHQYEECLIRYKNHYKFNFYTQEEKEKIHTSLSSYCTICGKIGIKLDNSIVIDYRTKVNTPIGIGYKLISEDELYEKYHNRMPVFYVDDIWKDKYINFNHDIE